MRTIAWVAAALAVAFTTSCGDRDRRDAGADAGDRVEAAGEQASGEVREGAAKTEDAVEDAADKTENAAENAADKTEDAAKDAGDKAGDAADDAGNAVEKAADEVGISSYSYERRDAFRKDVDERLAAMDKELAELGRGSTRMPRRRIPRPSRLPGRLGRPWGATSTGWPAPPPRTGTSYRTT